MFRNNEPTGVRVNTRSGPGDAPFAGPGWGIAGALLAVALLLQTQLLHYAVFRGAQLSIVLVVVVWFALRTDYVRAAFFGLIAGLCEDALSAQTGAAWTISTTLTAVCVSILSRWFFADSPAAAAAMVAVATLLRRMLFWIAMAIWSGYPAGYARLHLHQALWEALMNAVFVIAATIVARVAAQRREERASR